MSALIAWQSMRDYQIHIKDAEEYTSNLVLAAAQHAEDAIKEVEAFSGGMVERVEWEGLQNLDTERLRKIFQHQAGIMHQIHGVFVYDSEGRWIVTDKATTPPNANNSDREYFIYHKTHNDRGMHIGQVIESRSTGDYIIPISRRINRPDGSFAGVFLTTLYLKYFNEFYSSFKLSKDDIFTIALRDGTVLTRRPFDEKFIGTNISKGHIFSKYLPINPSGTARITSVIDGVDRINSYKQLTRYPVVVQSGLAMNNLLAQWYQDLLRLLFAFVAIASILILFGILLFYQIGITNETEEKLRTALSTLEKLAGEDGLTGLSNRRSLDQTLPLEIGRALRSNSPLGVIMLDIDHFKKYNDHYGHIAGDICIKAVSECIKSSARRPTDFASRYGGEEMVMLLPSTDESGTYEVAKKISNSLKSLDIAHEKSPQGRVTVSIGIYCLYPTSGAISPDKMLTICDERLYKAKEAGRDTIYPIPMNG
ncbi:GGDEF domain-containing protein [Pseudomonas psychrotolerans]|nr:GGDEF domain-containing protein [Pseudomonas psychrotolerans]